MDLKTACDKVLADKDLQPKMTAGALVTHCNEAVYRICTACGVNDFNLKMMANDMIAFMENNWTKVSGSEAHEHAIYGKIAIATEKGERHGHVAVVYPAPMQVSGSWGKSVPMLANVGRKNGVLRASECFHLEPSYYVAS